MFSRRKVGRLDHQQPRSLHGVYQRHFQDRRRERLFLASVSFLLAFGVTRAITHSIRRGVGPFHNVIRQGRHIHHLVWGNLLIIIVGYLWLRQMGTGLPPTSHWASRLTAVLFGTGAAVTLDEFALWLNLEDDYWSPKGRVSVDAVVIFGTLLSIGFWGGPFFRGLYHLARRVLLRAG